MSDAPAPVLAAGRWPTNAELIADVARLGYVSTMSLTFDATYGRGVWWKAFRPVRLVTNDIDPESEAEYADDFRATRWPDSYFDVVAYDPPYVSVGGRSTTTLPDLHARYGLTDAPRTPLELQRDVVDRGLDEAQRITSGLVLVKCQDYVTSGRLVLGTHWTLTHALSLGMSLVDRFEHVTHVRPQPAGRRQVHARRNLSTLFVLRKR